MIDSCRGVQGIVHGSVQGKLLLFIGLCRVCRGFSHMRAREIKTIISHTPHTLARVMRARTPARPAHPASRLRFTHAQTPAHTPTHLAQKKK